MAEIDLPDGSRAKIPGFALESTQAQMLTLLKAQVAADKAAMKTYEKIIELSKEANDQADDDSEEAKKARAEQERLLKGIDKTLNKKASLLSFDNIASGTNKASAALNSFTVKLLSFTGAAVGFLFKSTMDLGNTMAELAKNGMGFAGQNTAGTLAAMNALGISTEDAAAIMKTYSSVIAVQGQQAFLKVNKSLAQLTGNGAQLGLRMSELAAIAGEDMEIRQKLGIFENINADRAAKRSADLYKMQLAATKLLGKSIEEIRGASENTLANNEQVALRMLAITRRLSPEAAAQLTDSFTKMSSELSGMGLDQSLIDQIGNELFDVTAFYSEAGQDLFAALNATGPAGANLANSMSQINAAIKAGDIEKASAMMSKMPKDLGRLADSMSPEQLEAFANQLKALGPAGEKLALSLGSLSAATKNAAKGVETPLDPLAIAAKNMQSILDRLGGFFQAFKTRLAEAFGPMLTGILSAFDDVGKGANKQRGIFTALTEAGNKIINTLKRLIYGVDDGKDSVHDMAETVRNTVIPVIDKFADWFANGGGKLLFDTFKFATGVFEGLVTAGSWLFDVLAKVVQVGTDVLGFFVDMSGEDGPKSIGKAFGMLVVGMFAFNKGLQIATATMSGMRAVRGLFGGGGAAAAAAPAAAGGAKGGAAGALTSAGRGIGNFAKGIGKGIQGIFEGLAKGISAFANPTVLLGAAGLAGAIAVIGAGIAAASWIMGKALPTLAEGLQAVAEIDGEALIKAGLGITAFGVGLAALGAGSAIGAVGGIVSGILGLFGGETKIPWDKIEEFAKYNLPADRIKNNAMAVVAYSSAMAALAAGNVVNLIGSVANGLGSVVDGIVNFCGAEPPIDKMLAFAQYNLPADRIANNAKAVVAYTAAMTALATGNVINLIGSIANLIGSVVDGIVNFFGGEPPMAKLAAFGMYDINADGVKRNAGAVVEWAKAMAALAASNTIGALGSLGRVASAVIDGLFSFFGGDTSIPVDEMNEFGAMQLNVEGITKNARAVSAFAQALKGLTSFNTDNIDDFKDSIDDKFIKAVNRFTEIRVSGLAPKTIEESAAAMKKLYESYKKLSELDADNLTAVSEAMSSINKEIVAAQEANKEQTNPQNQDRGFFGNLFGSPSQPSPAPAETTPSPQAAAPAAAASPAISTANMESLLAQILETDKKQKDAIDALAEAVKKMA